MATTAELEWWPALVRLNWKLLLARYIQSITYLKLSPSKTIWARELWKNGTKILYKKYQDTSLLSAQELVVAICINGIVQHDKTGFLFANKCPSHKYE
jgi:hypothetical protein